MAARDGIPVDVLRQLLRPDFGAGLLFWLHRDVGWFEPGPKFSAARIAAVWNGHYAGRQALTAPSRGYRVGSIFDVPYFAHRVLWGMYTGAWPKDQLDHINGIRSDNRICNLRQVSNAENSRNVAMRRNNTSSVVGVGWHELTGKWRASITLEGRMRHLGLFADFDMACAARKAAEQGHGYHPNHGRRSLKVTG